MTKKKKDEHERGCGPTEQDKMDNIRKFKEQILKEYPRLGLDSEFTFSCHPGVPCFNACCRDINIFLTPYDILRLRKHLGITSAEFLKKYTLMPFDKNLKYPVLVLKMQDNAEKTCHFLSEKGCTVYEDRPWACRMYPLGLASPGDAGSEALDKEFYFLLKEPVCKGFDESRKFTVREWIAGQGIAEYDEMGKGFKDLTLHKYFRGAQALPPKKIEMFFMACYDLDKFRDFVFKSSFFDKFVVDAKTRKSVETDDKALLEFAFKWLRFALFGEDTMTVKSAVLAEKEAQLAAKRRALNAKKN